MLFTSSHTPLSPRLRSSPLPIISHNSLLGIKHYDIWNQRAGRSCFPRSVNFLRFFLAACSKVFRKASLSLMKEQVSRLAKSAVVQYVTVFRLILAKRVKHTDLGLETELKGIILWALTWAVTSLWPQKVTFRSQNYSARAKLMVISDQARDLVKICFEGRRPCVPFKTARLHPGSWINRLCQQSLHVMIYVEKARVIERE